MRHFEGLTGPKGRVFLGALCLDLVHAQCGSYSEELPTLPMRRVQQE